MPWYYIEARHGGGGQSTTTKWVWRDEDVPLKTSGDIENLVDGEFAGTYFGERVSFTAKRVTKLPAKVKAHKIAGATAAILAAQKMQRILEVTKTHPPRCTGAAPLLDRKLANPVLRNDPKWPTPMSQCWKKAGHRGKCQYYGIKRDYEKFGQY